MPIERIDIVLGSNCNNNCSFCVLDDKSKKFKSKSKEEIIRDLKESSKECDFLTLTGGEPTIRKDILDIVETAKKLGFNEIHLQTNGRMLSYNLFCKKLIEKGVTSFTISFHADCEELGDKFSKTKGSFQQTLKGMENIKKYGAKLITNTVIFKQNYKNLLKITKKAIEMNADQIQMVFIRPQEIGRAHV